MKLVEEIRACTLCKADLPLPPRPILQGSVDSRILIAGQAPGRITHEKGIPFDDPSGNRLRLWLGVDRDVFYNEKYFAIVPMGFCFPGSGKNGDAAPLPQCAETWRSKLLKEFRNLQLTLVIGQYAQDWHLGRRGTVTEIVSSWRESLPDNLPLPHPSPRNNRWLKANPWFENDLVPEMQQRVKAILELP
tara:strand:+ start:5020 stop:5589 length:570 start_codon:yes stop_codon:yes gene_type:complete